MITIVEIAQKTGFSKSTVSAVLSGGRLARHASAATRKLILNAAREMGYSPNQAARSLRQKQSKLIAILDATNFSSYSPQILAGINAILRRNQCQQMHCIFGSAQDLQEQVESLQRFRPDGWIVVGYLQPESRTVVSELIASGNEVVQVCSTIVLDGASSVYVDPYAIGKIAAEYFMANHHSHILYAALGQGSRCLDGFRETFNASGNDFDSSCFVAEYGINEGYGRSILRNWIARGKKETAVFAFNDVVAAAVISEATRYGIRVPQELSVLGIDGLYFGSLLSPAVTTVLLPQYARGAMTAELLMKRLQNSGEQPPEILNMSPEIVERESLCSIHP